MNYSSEQETDSLLSKHNRSEAERKLEKMLDDRGANEQGAEAYPILYKIAIELIEGKK